MIEELISIIEGLYQSVPDGERNSLVTMEGVEIETGLG
jgi:hypothetical protein